MDAERWKRVDELLQAALQLPAERQDAFLRQQCGNDTQLLEEVQSLLTSDRQAGSFLDPPVANVAAQLPTLGATSSGGTTSAMTLTAGQTISHYRVLEPLGSGGMGEVWLAEQTEPVRRRVALKLVKAGMNTREVMVRFESERQALALMDHPAMAKVFDAGSTAQGTPYFVMEYVAGVPITTYCDSHRLSIRERLELFMHVCEGVQHAHQKAIIHRDLKPSNILVQEVNGRATPKIIDFGLAKALTQKLSVETMFTRVGTLVGTPDYMSPEQVQSSGEDIDTRTDVYSLGIIFYELLAGGPPLNLRNASLEELLRRIREEEPPKPSTKFRSHASAMSIGVAQKRQMEAPALAKQMRGELDSIALKALAKERSRRYASPSDFAADIQRYLTNEAVLAVPPSLAYQAHKFARRHRGILVTAAAFAVVLIAAAGISVRQSIRASKEAAVAQAVNNFLQNDLLAQASTNRQPGTNPDPDLKVRTALDRAAERIEGKFANQPEVEASIRGTIGQTYSELGLYPEARKQLERALELQSRVLGAENPKTFITENSLGWTVKLQGKYQEAETLLNQAVVGQRRVLGPEHFDTLMSMNNLAVAYADDGKYAQAEELNNQVFQIRRRVLGPEHRDTLMSMNNLAVVYQREGKYAQAEALDIQVSEIQHRRLGPEHPDTLLSLSNLASVYELEGKYAQAETLDGQVVEIRGRVLGPDHPDTLVSKNALASVYAVEGKYAQAEAIHRQVLEVRRRTLGAEHPDTLRSMGSLAMVYEGEGEFPPAEAINSQVLEIRRRVLGPEHPDTLDSMNNLAIVYSDDGKYAQAEALDRQALEIKRRRLGPEHPGTLLSMSNLAEDYADESEYAEAEALFNQTLAVARRVEGSEHPDTLTFLSAFTGMYQRKNDYALAQKYAAQALAGRRHSLGSKDPDTMASAADLALAYVSQGKFAETEPLAREAMETCRKMQPDHWQRFRAESLLGESLAGQKKYAAAEPLLLEGYHGMLERKDRIGVPDRYHLHLAHHWLVQLYRQWGKSQRADEIAKGLER